MSIVIELEAKALFGNLLQNIGQSIRVEINFLGRVGGWVWIN